MARPLASPLAAVIVAVPGLLCAFVLGTAFADGELRRREAPLRAILGNEAFDELSAGRSYPQHYLQRPPAPAWIRAFGETTSHDPARERRVPDFELRALDGTPWRMADRRGKAVILNFWTVTCQPCIEEMPSLIELGRMLRGRSDVELVTISIDGDAETARTVVPDGSLTVLLDPERRVVRDMFGTRLFPETWIVDPRGVVRLRIDGSRDWASPLVLDAIAALR